MRFYGNDGSQSVRAKLTILLAIACAALLLLGGGGVLALQKQQSRMKAALATQAAVSRALIDVGAAHAGFKTQVQEWKNILLRGNDLAAFDKYLHQFRHEAAAVAARLDEVLAVYAVLGLPAGEVKALQAAHQGLGREYLAALDRFDRGDALAGQKVDVFVKGKDREAGEAMKRLVQQIEQVAVERATSAVSEADDDYRTTCNLFLAAFAAAVALLVVFAAAIARGLLKQLGGEPAVTVGVVHRIAEGDVAPHPVLTAAREGMLLAVAKMRERLSGLIAEIQGSASGLSGSAGKISDRAASVKATAQRQSGVAGEVAAAAEELASSIAAAAENARQVKEQASDSGRIADDGARVVHAAADALRNISDTVQRTAEQVGGLGALSGQISAIVQVIREIAEQTNLLALNAAIEAARAGESGRGFAVVADEVRKLAERTTLATSQIADVIGSIQQNTERVTGGIGIAVDEVAAAASLADEAAHAINRIQDETGEMLRAVSEIVLALQEQNAASASIASLMETLAHDAEEVTHRAVDNACEAENLVALSGRLQASVAQFRC